MTQSRIQIKTEHSLTLFIADTISASPFNTPTFYRALMMYESRFTVHSSLNILTAMQLRTNFILMADKNKIHMLLPPPFFEAIFSNHSLLCFYLFSTMFLLSVKWKKKHDNLRFINRNE